MHFTTFLNVTSNEKMLQNKIRNHPYNLVLKMFINLCKILKHSALKNYEKKLLVILNIWTFLQFVEIVSYIY